MTISAFRPVRAGLVALLATCISMGYAGRSHQTVASAAENAPRTHQASKFWVYIGTYTNTGSKGIYIYQMDAKTGALTPKGHGPAVADPSFLAIHPNHRFLYAADEVANFQGTDNGAISAFAIDRHSGQLTLLDQQASHGSGPCFVTVDRAGKNALTANYGSGSVAVLPIKEDGSLEAASSFDQHTGTGAVKARQEGPHAHSFNVSPDNRFAIAADLGLDKLLVYRLDAEKGTITPNDPPFFATAPGSGPRHFAFHPDGRHAYVINEINSTITALTYDPTNGSFADAGTLSTLPADFKGSSTCADIEVHPSGKFLYGSNRGHDSIAMFSIEPGTGKLHSIGFEPTGGKTPRNFGIDPTGRFLIAANQDTDNLVVFRIDARTGKLHPTGQVVSVPRPVCVKMMPVE